MTTTALARSLSHSFKRLEVLKPARRAQGNLVETPAGGKALLVMQKAADIWRSGKKSIHEAMDEGVAGLAVDLMLLRQAERKGATHVIVVIEEQAGVYVGLIGDFSDPNIARTREGYTGRTVRVVGMHRFRYKSITVRLKPKRKRAIAAA